MTSGARKVARRLTVNVRVLPSYAQEIERADLRRAARAAFKSAGGQGAGGLTVMVTDDAQIRELNRVYRSVDAPTDVLAFGETGEADGFIAPAGEAKYWGDIIISYPRALEQAATYGHPLHEELALLVVHGTLHLMGCDHEQAADKEKMWGAQNAALVQLGINWQP
jgi:probable rRNA maturation factor